MDFYDADFEKFIKSIAEKFECTVVINWETKTITFDGDEKVKDALAIELGKYFA